MVGQSRRQRPGGRDRAGRGNGLRDVAAGPVGRGLARPRGDGRGPDGPQAADEAIGPGVGDPFAEVGAGVEVLGEGIGGRVVEPAEAVCGEAVGGTASAGMTDSTAPGVGYGAVRRTQLPLAMLPL
jgi:hypothetical protein